MIPLHYGGIDRVYGDISIECADKILDMVEDYVELVEAAEGGIDGDKRGSNARSK